MKAVILAGGAGQRLREVVRDIPKPMASVAGKPFLEYLVMQLVKWGIGEIVLSIGYKGEIIKSYFSDGRRWGVKVTYSEEDEPLGTGGSLREAIRKIDSRRFIAMNGDSFLDVNFNRLLSYHEEKEAAATMALARANDVSRYGKVDLSERGEVIRFVEKGTDGGGLINGGVYLFNCDIIEHIPSGSVSLEKEVLPLLVKRGLYGMATDGYFIDIGTPQDYRSLCDNPTELVSSFGR